MPRIFTMRRLCSCPYPLRSVFVLSLLDLQVDYSRNPPKMALSSYTAKMILTGLLGSAVAQGSVQPTSDACDVLQKTVQAVTYAPGSDGYTSATEGL